MILPEKVRELTPYEPVTGNYRIRCDANESCFSLPDALWKDAQRRMTALELNRYPDPYATECCELMARWCGVDPSQVVAGNGSDELISLIETCLLEKGNTVATLAPDFSMYEFYTSIAEMQHVSLPKRGDLSVDADAVIASMRETGADLLIFSNPCNPTSVVLPREDVLRIVRSTDALVVVDEAYMDFADDSVLEWAGKLPNLLVLKTCSKAIGLAGARMGFAIGDKKLIDAIKSVKSPYNVNSLSQALTAAVLSQPEYLRECAGKLRTYAEELCVQMKALADEFPNEIKAPYPTATNFVYLAAKDAQVLRRMLLEQGIAIRAMNGHLRISTGMPEENKIVVDALRNILASRRKAGAE